nr:hypothetical protein [Tanacetum cinerariifolium]
LHHKFISISISIPSNRYAVKAMALGNQTSLDADLQVAADANKPISSPVKDADLVWPRSRAILIQRLCSIVRGVRAL